ncbi:MAG: hypothetical protein ACRYFS_08145 [Janthinobacterium lividum]
MKRAPIPTPGQTGPRRPHPSINYRPLGRLADLARPADPTASPAEIVDFALTSRLSGNRLADTWSWGVLKLPSGRQCPVCTTFGQKGFLLLELLKSIDLTDAETAAIARAVVAGHVRERARHSRQGAGRN